MPSSLKRGGDAEGGRVMIFSSRWSGISSLLISLLHWITLNLEPRAFDVISSEARNLAAIAGKGKMRRQANASAPCLQVTDC